MSDAAITPSPALASSSCKLRKAAWIAIAFLTFLLAAVLVLPQFIDLGLFKRTYLPRFEESLNRRVDVGEVRLRLIPTPSIHLSNLRVFDRVPASDEPALFSAQQVRLRLRFWPLLKGRFEASELVLDNPSFNLVKRPDGSFNFSDNARKKSVPVNRGDGRKLASTPKAAGETTPAPLLFPGNLSIRNGQLNLFSKGEPTVRISGIALSLRHFAAATPFPFKASFDYPGLGNVALYGDLDYQAEKALLELKNNRLRIHDLVLPLKGVVSNLSSMPRLDLTLRGTDVDAKPAFQILSVFGLAPRETEVFGPMDLNLDVTGPADSVVMQIAGSFKDVKVHGKRALKGTLTGQASILLPLASGPVSQRLQGNGRLVARDGELTNVDLIKKIERVTGLIGLSTKERRQATTFKTMEAEFIIRGGYAEFTRLYLVNPQMEVTGDGTMTLERPALNLALNTALSQEASIRAGRGRITSFFKDKAGRVVVPLKVIGPVENPTVDLNAGKLAEIGLPQNAEKGFSSFFKRLFRGR
jgi:AsmA protein